MRFSDLISSSFLHVVIMLANADSANISLKERITFSSPTPLILRKMAALIQVDTKIHPRHNLVHGYIMTFSSFSVGSSVTNWKSEKFADIPTEYVNFILMMTEAVSQNVNKKCI